MVKNSIRLLRVLTKLCKFEIQKYGQILCVHKPYFLMPGHILRKLQIDVLLTFTVFTVWSVSMSDTMMHRR